MANDSRNNLLKDIKQRKFLNKDFEGFKNDLFEYAKIHFPNRIQDFSDASLGGMFLELAAYVGDVQSFYLDHQFHELDPTSAVEPKNIERHLKNSGIEITGASPAVVLLDFSIQVIADTSVNPPIPLKESLPVLQSGSTVKSNNGITFELIEDLDYSETIDNNLIADIRIASRDANNNPLSFILTRRGFALSGTTETESFSIGTFEAFKKFTLSKPNITQIISVRDSVNNEFYEVKYLTQDTVFKAILNIGYDKKLVKDNLIVLPAPYRFIKQMNLSTKLTTLTFGGGNGASLDNDIIPDPSEFAIPLYGKRTFSRFTINPGNMLQSQTLGVVVPNSTITINYRYGGGLNHNVSENTIRGLNSILMTFPNNPSAAISQYVRKSLNVNNAQAASGGEDALTTTELKNLIPASKASQERIVTKEDLLSRVYTMPSNFGRVYRASIRQNPNNPLATQLFIVSRNADKQFVISPDSLKKNLETYLNSYRMISDAIDILDAQVVNLKIEFSIITHPDYNNNLVLQNIISRLKSYFQTNNFNIDQPIIVSDIHNIIYNNVGVVSVTEVKIKNLNNLVNGKNYSNIQFDVESNTIKGILVGPPGSIFEVRYPDFDIEGTVV